MSNKGSSFERDICRQLSLWWTDGERDDVFWRTSGSGARANVRDKKDKTTFGQYGDVQATDPIGQPLIDVCTIELKRGHSGASFADLIDKSEEIRVIKGVRRKPAMQVYEKFIQQAIDDNIKSPSLTWLLIVKRDRRKPIVMMSLQFSAMLKDVGSTLRIVVPSFLIYCRFRDGSLHEIFGITFDRFVLFVKPDNIRRILRRGVRDVDYTG